MSKPRIVLCNERFLARFGVDRILVLLARRLQEDGSDVALRCLRSDREALEVAGLPVEDIPLKDGLHFVEMDIAASNHVLDRLLEEGPPDAVVIGGWPFFSLGALAQRHGIRSIFIDAGAVPHNGMPEAALPIQRELRRLRRLCLGAIDEILPISEFIARSQTLPDRGTSDGVETVLLGADHLAGLDEAPLSREERSIVEEMDKAIASGQRHVLVLGRFEEHGYKNSPEAFDVFRRVRRDVRKVRLLILGGPDKVDVPADLKGSVTILPTISDECLAAITRRSALGLSMSLWEGFNLPLAEMQWFDRPALAFNVGAHPEVAADPWLLCETREEMARKAVRLLEAEDELQPWLGRSLERFRERFTWERTLSTWVATIPRRRPAAPQARAEAVRRPVLIDVTNSGRDPANSGVIRVTRRLSRELSARPELEVWFVTWDAGLEGGRGGFRLLTDVERSFLASNGGPRDVAGPLLARFLSNAEDLVASNGRFAATPPVFLVPEIALDGSALARHDWASRRGCRIANIFYDMIPMFEPKYVDRTVRDAFPDYLKSVSSSDAMWSISGFSESEFERYARDRSMSLPEKREAVWLPGQFSDRPRSTPHGARVADGKAINILCVATLEPRKNHVTLIEAFARSRELAPGVELHLHLVGNSYVNAEGLMAWVLDAISRDDRITWHRILPDATLAWLYENAAFTVYPSLAEGFGLPIMESLWMGRPCICHNGGVMAELAAGGGCLPVNMADAEGLASAMKTLAEDDALRRRLAQEAQARSIGTWEDYAAAIARRICEL